MFKKIVLILLTVITPAFVLAEDKDYMLNYNKIGISAEININGMPICSFSKGDISASENVNLWIMPGKNIINISILEKNKDSVSNYISAGISLQAPWSYDSKKPKLLSIEIPQFKDKSSTERLQLATPFNQNYEFTPVILPPVKLWSEAANIILDEKTTQETLELVTQLYAILDKHDGLGFLNLYSYAISENALAMGYDPKSYMESAKTNFSTLFNQKEFIFKKPKAEDLTLKLIANNKVIMVSTKNGNPSLDIGLFSKNIFIAMINGKLTIVRL